MNETDFINPNFLNFSLSTDGVKEEKNAALFRAAFCQIILNSYIPEYYENNLAWLALAQREFEHIQVTKHFSIGDNTYHIADFELFLELVRKHQVRIDLVSDDHKGICMESGKILIPIMYDKENGVRERIVISDEVAPFAPIYKQVEAFPAIEEVVQEKIVLFRGDAE